MLESRPVHMRNLRLEDSRLSLGRENVSHLSGDSMTDHEVQAFGYTATFRVNFQEVMRAKS